MNSEKHMEKNSAVFLDRDGVINNDGGLVWQIGKLEILPGIAEAVKLLHDNGWIVVVLTNQPVVARGWATLAEVENFNKEIDNQLAAARAKIDAWYVCPHHPRAGLPDYPGLSEYRLDCPDRKPNTGMFKKAAKDFDFDLTKCYAVGDLPVDIKAGHDAGCKTILVRTGHAGVDPNPKRQFDVKPDFIADDLLAAAKLIISKSL